MSKEGLGFFMGPVSGINEMPDDPTEACKRATPHYDGDPFQDYMNALWLYRQKHEGRSPAKVFMSNQFLDLLYVGDWMNLVSYPNGDQKCCGIPVQRYHEPSGKAEFYFSDKEAE